jgi:hypothetical protein
VPESSVTAKGALLRAVSAGLVVVGTSGAGRTVCLPYGNGRGGSGDPGSSRILCFVFMLNRLEWVTVVQDELSACLTVTGEEVLETLGPLVSCVGCRY